jgi:hypothetical protein
MLETTRADLLNIGNVMMSSSLVVPQLCCLLAAVCGCAGAVYVRKGGCVKSSGQFEKVTASEGDGWRHLHLVQIVTNISLVEVSESRQYFQ